MNAGTVLVLAPHTDDGEIGCGGTIAKLAADGRRVIYVAFSAAEQSVLPHLPRDTLRTEIREATQVLGINAEDCVVLAHEVRRFPEQRQGILDAMIRLAREYNPDIVFVPAPTDTHQDHAVVAQEAFRAFKQRSLLGYEVPWNNLEFRTSCFVHLTEDHIGKKVEALRCYRSQAHREYMTENFLRSLATTRGVQIGARYAEAFDVIRWVMR